MSGMILGIAGLPLFFLWAMPSALAIVFGGIGLRQVSRSGAMQAGRGMAIAGIVLGSTVVALYLLGLAFAVMVSRARLF